MKFFAMFSFVIFIITLSTVNAKSINSNNQLTLKHHITPGLLPHEIQVTEEDIEFNEDGSYHLQYRQNDGQYRVENGIIGIDEETKENKIISVDGVYEFIRDDGKLQRVVYTADKNGFHPRVTVEDHNNGNEHDHHKH